MPKASCAGLQVLFLAAVLASLASPVVGGQTSSGTASSGTVNPGSTAEQPNWLSPAEVRAIVGQLPAPPSPGTSQDAADLQTEIAAQTTRTSERSNQAVADAGNAAALIMKDVDPRVTPADDPGFYRFLELLKNQATAVDVYAKNRWQRPRPFVAHPELIHPLFTADGFSYPSGHSTVAMCEAVILEQIYPDKATLIMQDAERIAQSRVVAGVHYETDVEQGKVLGEQVARELLATPAFVSALDEARAEVKRDR